MYNEIYIKDVICYLYLLQLPRQLYEHAELWK